MRLQLPSVILACLLCIAPAVHAAVPTATTLPAQPLIEATRDGQHLNFDLVFANAGDRALELTGIEATLFDREGRFFSQRRPFFVTHHHAI